MLVRRARSLACSLVHRSAGALSDRQNKLESLLKGRRTRDQLQQLNVIQETEVR